MEENYILDAANSLECDYDLRPAFVIGFVAGAEYLISEIDNGKAIQDLKKEIKQANRKIDVSCGYYAELKKVIKNSG